MRNETPVAVILRRKWLVLAVLVVVVGAAAALSMTLEKVYSTESTLLVALPSNDQSFDTVQAGQAIARSYADIVESPNIAAQVADRLGGTDTGEVAAATSFEAPPETQLLKITAEASSPERAQAIADTYAEVFTDYAQTELRDTDASISIADPAPLPASPARPKPVLYVLIAAVLGLGLGIGLALLAQRLDRRLRTAEDVEDHFDLTVLGRIPRRRRSEASLAAFLESYRVVRTNLQFAGDAGSLRSLAVTSADAGEGKTTAVANLARAFAESGRRVVAVEADFRRPALQAELDEERDSPLRPGLSNYLVEASTLDQVVHHIPKPGLDLLPAGPLPPSPSGLLDSERGRGVVASLLHTTETVVVDCPPLSAGADASVISGWVDGVVLVIDLESSTDRSVREALRQLETVNAPVVGALLNRDRELEARGYDYYYAAPEQDGLWQEPPRRLRVLRRGGSRDGSPEAPIQPDAVNGSASRDRKTLEPSE